MAETTYFTCSGNATPALENFPNRMRLYKDALGDLIMTSNIPSIHAEINLTFSIELEDVLFAVLKERRKKRKKDKRKSDG